MPQNDQQNSDSESQTREQRYRNDNPHMKPRRRRPWLITLLVILAFLIVGGVAYGVKTWNAAKNTMNTTYQSTGSNVKMRNVDKVIKNGKPFTILLLGTDTGALGRSASSNFSPRTDTMIVATINPKTKHMSLTSIPRDTEVVINGQTEKVNAAYTVGGAATAVSAVQKLVNVPIDFYVLINMGGLKQIVDAMGGVTLTPTMTFKYEHANVKKGVKIKLGGAAALDYSRMRYDDPLGDYGRQKRQKQLIKTMVSQSNSLGSLANMEKITQQLSKNMRTDLTWDDMVALDTKYKDATHHMKSFTLQGEDATIDGLSYQTATPEERHKVSNQLRDQLQLDSVPLSDFDNVATVGSSNSSSSSNDNGAGPTTNSNNDNGTDSTQSTTANTTN